MLDEDEEINNKDKFLLEMQKHFSLTLNDAKKNGKVKKMCLNQRKEILYSIGEDRRISIISLFEDKHLLNQIKCCNSTPKSMVFH